MGFNLNPHFASTYRDPLIPLEGVLALTLGVTTIAALTP